jgi:hypothetical protein
MAPLPPKTEYPELKDVPVKDYPRLLVEAKNQLVEATQAMVDLHDKLQDSQKAHEGAAVEVGLLIQRWYKLRKTILGDMETNNKFITSYIDHRQWSTVQQAAIALMIGAGYLDLMDKLQTEEGK